ncbi:hypothetical protein JNM05_08820 [bacterium]|nr:hypothetical protein [bacterium]
MDKLFVAGTVFIDFRAINIQGEKPKHFLGLNDADDPDDVVLACVFSTEYNPGALREGCNKEKQKFYLPKNKFAFQTHPTTIWLIPFRIYNLSQIINGTNCKIEELCDQPLFRQIKNCIDKKHVQLKYHSLLK